MAWRDRAKNAYSKVRGGVSKIFTRGPSSAGSSKLDALKEQLEELRLKQAVQAERTPYRLFDRAKFVRGTKKYSAIIIILFLIALPVIIFVYLSASGHTGFFSYQEQSYYGPIFSAIGSYISPIWGLISGELTCVANPVACVSPTQGPVTNYTAPTFSSFITANPTQNPAVAIITANYPGTPTDLFYTVEDTANVPLGSGTDNNILLNTSCGSTNDPAAAFDCQYSTNVTSPKEYKVDLTPLIYPSQTITNQTSINAFCPTNLQVSVANGGSIASLQLNFTIENYSAASIAPIEFVTSSYAEELSVAGQPLMANAPTVNFVSPGPIHISLSTSVPQPVETNTGDMPINVEVNNSGTGNYYLNSLSIFVPMSLWSVNVLSEMSQLNPTWRCSPATGGLTANFVLPSADYWDCSAENPNSVIPLVLPQLVTLPGAEHFDTVPLLAHINYNYIEDMDMPYVIRAGSAGACSSSS